MNTLRQIQRVISQLATARPLFHSEADFQHAFAWSIHESLPQAAIRLEVPFSTPAGILHVDLLVRHENEAVAIELKYKTRVMETHVRTERFTLASHAAQDLGRYDFIKDVHRLEQLCAKMPSTTGLALFLTNDSAYWTPLQNQNVGYAAFSTAEGRNLQGTLLWGASAGSGTTKGREAPITLSGTYPCRWQDYSILDAPRYGVFRYLALPITANAAARAGSS